MNERRRALNDLVIGNKPSEVFQIGYDYESLESIYDAAKTLAKCHIFSIGENYSRYCRKITQLYRDESDAANLFSIRLINMIQFVAPYNTISTVERWFPKIANGAIIVIDENDESTKALFNHGVLWVDSFRGFSVYKKP